MNHTSAYSNLFYKASKHNHSPKKYTSPQNQKKYQIKKKQEYILFQQYNNYPVMKN